MTQGAPNISHAKAWLQDACGKLRGWANGLDTGAPVDAQELRDLAATLDDTARRAPLPEPGAAIVVMTEAARDAYAEAYKLIREADAWAQGADLATDLVTEAPETAQRIVALRREQVGEMERSLLRSLAHLMTVAQEHDGPVRVTRDSPASFYWRHTNGYHGGIIFHRSHADGQPTPAGTWSIHT